MHVSDYRHGGNIHVGLDFRKKPQPRHRAVARLVNQSLPANGTVLDIGCGRGDVLALVQGARPDARISIADAYDVCLVGTRERLGSVEESFQIDERTFNVRESIRDQRYDVIVMCHILEHLRRPVDAVQDALSLLTERGKLIVAVPNLAAPSAALASTFNMYSVNEGHVCGWNWAHWRNFWANVIGVQSVSYHVDTADLIPGRVGGAVRRTFGPGLARLVPGWSSSLIAVAGR